METFLSLLGIALSIVMIRYREALGDLVGEASWMHSLGGSRGIVVIAAVFLFFFSFASLTGTTELLFKPLRFLIPGLPGETKPELAF